MRELAALAGSAAAPLPLPLTAAQKGLLLLPPVHTGTWASLAALLSQKAQPAVQLRAAEPWQLVVVAL